MRIQSLETDLALSLSENITLREENIHLQQELDINGRQQALDNVGAVKRQLDHKLVELSDLLTELGIAQSTIPKPLPLEKLGHRKTPRRNSDQQRRRSAALQTEIAEADGRLPSIVEGKYFPRRTLEYVVEIVEDSR